MNERTFCDGGIAAIMRLASTKGSSMKLLIILSLVATSLLPVLHASATTFCMVPGSDDPNNQSSLSSTSKSSDSPCPSKN
jgi:hypothetical protein